MTRNYTALCFLAVASTFVYSQNSSLPPGITSSVTPPTLNAKLTVGFNYDLLRAPTDVSFDYAKGYFGLNFPLQQSGLIPKQTSENVWAKMSEQTTVDSSSGAQFQPQATAGQYANTTIRVDVPMLGGVASFSHIQNVYLNYSNVLGNSTVKMNYDTTIKSQTGNQHLLLLLLGSINVPIEGTLSWETMTFGYAYRINKEIIAAMNIHRHLFRIDMLANIDAEFLGHGKVDQTASKSGSSTGAGIEALGGNSISPEFPINYSEVGGHATGHYEAEAWSYSLGVELWRFTLTSRFGIETKAKGNFSAKYSLPSGLIDPHTFQMNNDLFTNPTNLISKTSDLATGKVDSVSYSTKEDARWKLPSGHTIAFDIIRDKVTLSYTKLIGDIEMYHEHQESLATGGIKRSVDLDVGVTIDNIILLNAHFYSAFLNVGMFTMDIRLNDQRHILGKAFSDAHLDKLKWGDAAMLPVLNFGAAFGAKTKLGFDIALLPLPAFKTGVAYIF
jgi:hypothetical protein